jgi:hypothetical protein
MVRINVANRNLTVDERAGRSRVVRSDYLVIAGGARHPILITTNGSQSLRKSRASIDAPRDYDKRAADTIARRIRDAEPYVSV